MLESMLHYQKFAAERTRFQVRIFYTHTPPSPPPNSVTPYKRKSYPEIQMKDKHSVVSDKILLFDRKMFDLFQRMYFGNEHIFLLV